MWVRVISLAWLVLSGWYLFIAPSLELHCPKECDLRLMPVAATKDLPDVGCNLIIVARVGAERSFLHIHIFDASGKKVKKVIDKAERELIISGKILTALGLDPFFDESSLSNEDKQEIIRNATSIAGHTCPKTSQELKLTLEQVELVKLDLEHKIYPEIQKRLETREEWLIRKLTLAGGLLVAFLLYIWKPFGGERLGGITAGEDRRTRLEEDLTIFLTSRPICAALGLACVVSLFMDIHIRRSLLVIHQLGTWAAEYGVPALGGDAENFPGWEQFIRGRKPGNEGMHFSLIDAIQTGDLSVLTLVLLAFYYWVFQEICLREDERVRGLDWFNRLMAWAVMGVLGLFLLGAHLTSGNFKFTVYSEPWDMLFSYFWGCFIAWLTLVVMTIAWDQWGLSYARRFQPRQDPTPTRQ